MNLYSWSFYKTNDHSCNYAAVATSTDHAIKLILGQLALLAEQQKAIRQSQLPVRSAPLENLLLSQGGFSSIHIEDHAKIATSDYSDSEGIGLAEALQTNSPHITPIGVGFCIFSSAIDG